MRHTPTFRFLFALFLAGCGAEPLAPKSTFAEKPIATATASPNNAAPMSPPQEFDPVTTGMTVEGVKKLCDDNIAHAQTLLSGIKSLKGQASDKITFESTLGQLDEIALALSSAGEFPYLMSVAHPDEAVREAAKLCEPKTDAFSTQMWLDADLATVVKTYAAKNEKLDEERARLLSDTLRDFRRNGIDLPADKQKRLRELNETITKLGQEFVANIGASKGFIEVPAASLEGLPEEYKAKHPPKANVKIDISTDYPDFFPFMTYSKDRKSALKLYVLFTNRGGDRNVELLSKILEARYEKAQLLGYETWADYAIEPRMAKSSKTVRAFLEKIRSTLKEAAKAEFAEFMDEHVKLGGKKTDVLYPHDRYYLEDKIRERKYKFDSKELSHYFELNAVKKGLMDITARMYGIEYREVPSNAWHSDVTAFEVYNANNHQKIGKFYFDLHPRDNKYKHAAMFTLRTAKRLSDGSYQTPMAALVCNFPKPGDQPALMSHDEVVTFFHEFGHVLHHLLTQANLASYSGTATVRDFVEAPSQMFEEWPWSREVLDLFAKHHKTGEKIPDALFAAMKKSRAFGRALQTQRQVFLATLDLELHSRKPGFDTTKLVEEVQSSVDTFKYVEGTHFQSSFGHLIGYDAGYYGYQWALSLARDVLTRFRKEGLMNTETARAWRSNVLSKGGSADETTMIAKFLGRQPNEQAYLDYLLGRDE